jgi:PST family polysaccharide transporter
MLNKIRNLANTEVKKRLLSNFFSLSILQGANYILPFLTLPYLTRILGVEYFGLLAFSSATIAYFQIITDYGFNLTATKEISIYRDNKNKVIEIFSAVMTIKVILMFLSFVLMSILILSFRKFSQNLEVFYLTFGVIIGQVLFPIWFFQGLEKMKYIMFLNILAKSIFTIFVFVFVRKVSDYYIVPLLTSLGYIVVGIISLVVIKKKFNVNFEFQSINTIKYHLKEGWHIFISNILTSFYTVSATFILGLFSNNQVVGYYSLADKIVRVVSNIFSPINGAIFPFISKVVKTSKVKAKVLINKVLIYSTTIMILTSTLIFIFAKNIILFISSTEFEQSIIILQILAFLPVVLNIAIIISTNYLVNFGFQSKLAKIYLFTALISIILSFTLVPVFYEIGSAITSLVVELFATFCMVLVIKKNIVNAD